MRLLALRVILHIYIYISEISFADLMNRQRRQNMRRRRRRRNQKKTKADVKNCGAALWLEEKKEDGK